MKKERRIFGSKNPNSFMLLGLLNTLQRNGTITPKERESIFDLGYYIEELSMLKDAKELEKTLKDFIGKGE